MVWGTPGFTESLKGASGRAWELTFERRLAPRPGHAENPASSVWLVSSASEGGKLYAAKRQNVSRDEVESLVDEAAAWRKSSLDCPVLAQLVDVFVLRDPPCSVTFLHEFCARGHIPKRAPSEPVLLTIIADLAEASDVIARSTGGAHANISYETVLVDDDGNVKLIGFGAKRSAKLADNPSPPTEHDVADIGAFVCHLVLGRPLRDNTPPSNLPYEPPIVSFVHSLLEAPQAGLRSHEAASRAREFGGEYRAPIIDTSERASNTDDVLDAISSAETSAPDVQNAVEKLTSGVDAGGAYSAVLAALERNPETASRAIFKTLYNCPIAKDPLCAMRALTMLHNIMLDGPEELLETARGNDKFLDWVESTWTKEAVEAVMMNKNGEQPHPACDSFAGGDLAFYTSLLRRKSRFHMLSAGGFSGAWERTGKLSPDGTDVLVKRRRKVIGGMADFSEMTSEIGIRFARATDAETALKHASLRAIVDECCRAYSAAHGLANETKSVRDAEKLVPGFSRLWESAKALIDAVRGIRSADVDDWVEQFSQDSPPDIVKEAEFRIRGTAPPEVAEDMPETGWEETEKMIGDTDESEMTEKELKKERKRKKKEARAAAEAAEQEEVNGNGEPEKEITAADGAIVLHGAGAEEEQAVKTMFGDLLKLDGGDTTELHDEIVERVPGVLTDGEALASAFGAPPPAEGFDAYDDDDDGEGGYEGFKARQEQAKSKPSTGAWAARAGYGGGAMVLHQTVEVASNKSHAIFCQCSLCKQAEVENAAAEACMRGKEGYSDERYERRHYDSNDGSYQSVEYSLEDEDTKEEEGKKEIARVIPKEMVLVQKKLRMGDKIGEGAFGTVYKGEYKRETVAIKKMNKKMQASENALEEFRNEVYVMCAMKHENVLKCIAASLKKPDILLVTEFMKRGTLFDVLYKHHIKLTWSMIRKIALQVAEGMKYMHEEHGIVHRDLKSANILVDTAYNAKVGDFGLADLPRPPSNDGVCGTYQYMAPEVLAGEAHSQKSDVYAYALVLNEMICGTPPFAGMDAMQAAEQVLNNNLRPQIARHTMRNYANIIQIAWAATPAARPSFAQIVEQIKTTTK